MEDEEGKSWDWGPSRISSFVFEFKIDFDFLFTFRIRDSRLWSESESERESCELNGKWSHEILT